MRDDNVVKNEAVEQHRLEWLQKLRVEYADEVAAAVEAFLNGSPDLERELDRQAGELPQEIIGECKAVNARLWRKVKPKPKPIFGLLALPGKPKSRIEGPPTKIEAAPSVSGKGDFARELGDATATAVKLKELVGRIKIKPRAELQEQEPEPELEVKRVDVEPDVVGIERALVPVKRFASRDILVQPSSQRNV
jgi:hypothetical protein